MGWSVGACLDVILIYPRSGDLAQLPLALHPCFGAMKTGQTHSWLFSSPGLQDILCWPFAPRRAPTALDVKSCHGFKPVSSP